MKFWQAEDVGEVRIHPDDVGELWQWYTHSEPVVIVETDRAELAARCVCAALVGALAIFVAVVL